MATIFTPYSPMHIDCTIGNPYGAPPPPRSYIQLWISYRSRLSCESVQYIVTLIYTLVCLGEITYLYTSETQEGGGVALGNQVQIRGDNGLYYRYCHLQYGSNTHLVIGQRVDQNTFIGIMGNTGQSFGTHLHLECSTTSEWNCLTFETPGDSLLFGNERGTIVVYDDTPIPPTPTDRKKSKFPWVLYANKLRKNY